MAPALPMPAATAVTTLAATIVINTASRPTHRRSMRFDIGSSVPLVNEIGPANRETGMYPHARSPLKRPARIAPHLHHRPFAGPLATVHFLAEYVARPPMENRRWRVELSPHAAVIDCANERLQTSRTAAGMRLD